MAANGTGKLKVSTGPFGNDSLLQATVVQYDIEGGCWAPPYWVFGERCVQRDIDGFVQYESWIIEWKCNCVVQYDKFPPKGYKFHSSVPVDTLLKENVLRCCLVMVVAHFFAGEGPPLVDVVGWSVRNPKFAQILVVDVHFLLVPRVLCFWERDKVPGSW